MQSAIRAAIRSIPRGKVSTYGNVARAAGYANGARQAAATLHHSLGLPWHRVLGAGGEIKLRGDSAFEQRFRLEAEGVTFRGAASTWPTTNLSFRAEELHVLPSRTKVEKAELASKKPIEEFGTVRRSRLDIPQLTGSSHSPCRRSPLIP